MHPGARPNPAAFLPTPAGGDSPPLAFPLDPEEDALFRLDVAKVQLGVAPGARFDVPPELLEHWAAKEAARRARAEAHVASLEEDRLRREALTTRPVAKGPGRFTTDAAIAWGRRQGWTVIDREAFNHLTKRHHDLEGAVDVIFDDGTGRRVGVQGAGRGERASHLARFIAWGGPDKARRRALRVLYAVFERGDPTPLEVEEWA